MTWRKLVGSIITSSSEEHVASIYVEDGGKILPKRNTHQTKTRHTLENRSPKVFKSIFSSHLDGLLYILPVGTKRKLNR